MYIVMPPVASHQLLANVTKALNVSVSAVSPFVKGSRNGTDINSTQALTEQEYSLDTILQPNTTTVIGDSVAVVTDSNGDQSLTVLGPLFSVKP
mmetsp:Transcript_12624/g.15667  ORF Transcript_12624/g.15667 Transcript_12624/m.15667 type:complete len:94 (+) Transcript_12624:99-380(+)